MNKWINERKKLSKCPAYTSAPLFKTLFEKKKKNQPSWKPPDVCAQVEEMRNKAPRYPPVPLWTLCCQAAPLPDGQPGTPWGPKRGKWCGHTHLKVSYTEDREKREKLNNFDILTERGSEQVFYLKLLLGYNMLFILLHIHCTAS